MFLYVAGEDLESTKQKLGGQKTVKRCMRSTMFVDQTKHQFLGKLPADQRELSHRLHKCNKRRDRGREICRRPILCPVIRLR